MYDWKEAWCVFRLEGENGEQINTEYGGPMSSDPDKQRARDMMKFLNTANGQTKSQQKRILEQLNKDGKIPAGAVTGIPDPPPTTFV